jgi:hypothetical protein
VIAIASCLLLLGKGIATAAELWFVRQYLLTIIRQDIVARQAKKNA